MREKEIIALTNEMDNLQTKLATVSNTSFITENSIRHMTTRDYSLFLMKKCYCCHTAGTLQAESAVAESRQREQEAVARADESKDEFRKSYPIATMLTSRTRSFGSTLTCEVFVSAFSSSKVLQILMFCVVKC